MHLANQLLMKEQAYVDGVWIDAASGARLTVRNPANGAELATVPALDAAECARAIAAADAALPAWRSRTAKERAALLHAWLQQINASADDLAALITAECGKPRAEARGEVSYGASFVEWFAEEAKRAYGEVIPSPASDRRLLAIRQPIGVCAAITPWNFPLAMITRKVAPALAAGCTVVVKPAEQTPLSALALACLAEQAGLPPGVFNVVTGEPATIGAELTASPLVRHLSFTGSTAVGRRLMAECAPTVKKVALELGGNAPFIVFADADLDAAIDGALAAKYRNAGQTCVCANRFLIERPIYEEFAARLAERSRALCVGDGAAPNVQVGPLINQAALAKVSAQLEDALAKGGRILCGGGPHPLGGNFFAPTVIADASPAMRFAEEETFGPLAPLFVFDSEAEALALANATEAGLAAYLYTRDLGRSIRVAEGLEYGMVGINTGIISNEMAPFGGIKQSGIGREGSRHGLDEYLEIKYLCLAI